MSSASTFLSPDGQARFWGGLSPDMRSFIDFYESQEGWTNKYNEVPEAFHILSEALQKISHTDIYEDSKRTIRIMEKLIVILSHMPFGQAISAISWLDRGTKGSTTWSSSIYMSLARVAIFNKRHKYYSEYFTLYNRINEMLFSRMATKIFTSLNSESIKSIHKNYNNGGEK